jgi:PilZ domain
MYARSEPPENRRSTRIRIKVHITAQAVTEPMTCDGETIVVNLHGALISTAVPLRVGMSIEVHVILTDKRALAQVVYVDPDRPRLCGIGLDKPQNIWGVSLPPEDWREFLSKSERTHHR